MHSHLARIKIRYYLCKKHNKNNLRPRSNEFNLAVKTLEFASQEEFSNTLFDLITMNPNERSKWFADKNGFVSQQQASEMVSEQIGKAKSLDEAIKLRNSYGEFIFNADPSELDFTPYLRADQLGHSMVVNAYGNVKIAGDTVNFNSANFFEDTWIGKLQAKAKTKGEDSRLNYLYTWNDERKMWAEAYDVQAYSMSGAPSRRTLVIKANAQKKVCFIFCAWHTYNTNFAFNAWSTPQRYSGFDPSSGPLTAVYARAPQEVIISGGNSTPIALGDITSGTIATTLKIHTRGVVSPGILDISNPPKVSFHASTGRFDW